MSAFMSAQEGNEIVILSDGAGYQNDGTVVTLGSKVTVGKVVPIAVTTRGGHTLGRVCQQRLCDIADRIGVDQMLAILEDEFPSLASDPKYRGLDTLHLHIAAYSESRGLIRVSGHNLPQAFGDGEEPGKLMVVDGTYTAGTPASKVMYAACGVTGRRKGERLSDFLFRTGPNLMEAWRRTPAALLPGDEQDGPQYLIGGQCDFTLVTPDGAAIGTLKAWPDQIGQKIDPFAAESAAA